MKLLRLARRDWIPRFVLRLEPALRDFTIPPPGNKYDENGNPDHRIGMPAVNAKKEPYADLTRGFESKTRIANGI